MTENTEEIEVVETVPPVPQPVLPDPMAENMPEDPSFNTCLSCE